jgi:guanylate kinase
VHYHFLSHQEFDRLRQENAFLECKEVFGRGDWYGTLRSEVATGHQAGKWVLLEIDVEGARTVVDQVPSAVTIFLHPGSWEELERRLRARGTETEESFRRRLEVAQAEMRCRHLYQFEVINDTVERAVAEIGDILRRCGD